MYVIAGRSRCRAGGELEKDPSHLNAITALKREEVVTKDFDHSKLGDRTKVYRTKVVPPLYITRIVTCGV